MKNQACGMMNIRMRVAVLLRKTNGNAILHSSFFIPCMNPVLIHIESAVVRLFADGLEGAALTRGVGLALEQRGFGIRHNARIPSHHDGLLVAHATADLLVGGDTAVLVSENHTPLALRESRLKQWLAATGLAAVVSVEPTSDPVVLSHTKQMMNVE